MSREKQIEEMAITTCSLYRAYLEKACAGNVECYFNCHHYDRCEKLYNKGYRKQEWISVYDGMPEQDGKYLVYTDRGRVHTMYYYRTNAFGFEHWSVTHWMPLPEPPKMKGATDDCM